MNIATSTLFHGLVNPAHQSPGLLSPTGLAVALLPSPGFGASAANEAMLHLAARLAGSGPLRVLDGGNRFNAYRVARLLAAATAAARRRALERIQVRRAFTCHQVLNILSSTPAGPQPLLVLDMLSTFYDEQIFYRERYRLLQACLEALHRLSAAGPVVVSLHPPRPPHNDAAGLLPLIQAAADQVLFHEEVQPPIPLRLWQDG